MSDDLSKWAFSKYGQVSAITGNPGARERGGAAAGATVKATEEWRNDADV